MWCSESEKKMEYLSRRYKKCTNEKERFCVDQRSWSVLYGRPTTEEVKAVYNSNSEFLSEETTKLYNSFIASPIPYLSKEITDILSTVDVIKGVYTLSELVSKYGQPTKSRYLKYLIG